MPNDVSILKEMLEYNLPINKDWEFLCLTDYPQEQIDMPVLPLEHDLPGWWSKIELFRPDLEGEEIFYFDLDTVIVYSLSPVFNYKSPFLLLHDFYRGKKKQIAYQSSVMKFVVDPSLVAVYQEFLRHKEYYMHNYKRGGDQQFLEGQLDSNKVEYFQNVFPEQFVSYKLHCKDKKIPKNARVVVFHGKPRPKTVNYLNVREA